MADEGEYEDGISESQLPAGVVCPSGLLDGGGRVHRCTRKRWSSRCAGPVGVDPSGRGRAWWRCRLGGRVAAGRTGGAGVRHAQPDRQHAHGEPGQLEAGDQLAELQHRCRSDGAVRPAFDVFCCAQPGARQRCLDDPGQPARQWPGVPAQSQRRVVHADGTGRHGRSDRVHAGHERWGLSGRTLPIAGRQHGLGGEPGLPPCGRWRCGAGGGHRAQHRRDSGGQRLCRPGVWTGRDGRLRWHRQVADQPGHAGFTHRERRGRACRRWTSPVHREGRRQPEPLCHQPDRCRAGPNARQRCRRRDPASRRHDTGDAERRGGSGRERPGRWPWRQDRDLCCCRQHCARTDRRRRLGAWPGRNMGDRSL